MRCRTDRMGASSFSEEGRCIRGDYSEGYLTSICADFSMLEFVPFRGQRRAGRTVISLAATAGEHATHEVLNLMSMAWLCSQTWLWHASGYFRPVTVRHMFRKADCADQTRCLHLVASAGSPKSSSVREDWSRFRGDSSRHPLGHRKVGGRSGHREKSILIPDSAVESEWIRRRSGRRREGIRSFAGYPLVSRGEVLGVLALFSREALCEQDFASAANLRRPGCGGDYECPCF